MAQGSNFIEEETMGEMTITEVVRMNNWLRAKGMSDKDILDCQNYIATGVVLPTKEPTEKESD